MLMREDYAAKRPSPLVSASRCGTFHTVSDAGWTYVGIAVAVAFVVPGCGCWCRPVAIVRQATSRPARDSFRARRRRPPLPRASDWPWCSTPPSSRASTCTGWSPACARRRGGTSRSSSRRRSTTSGSARPARPSPRTSTSCARSGRRHRACRGPGDGRLRRADGAAPRWHRQPARPQPRAADRRPRARRDGRDHRPQPAHRRRLDAAEPRRGAPRGARRRGLVGRAAPARVPRHGRPRSRRRDHGGHLREAQGQDRLDRLRARRLQAPARRAVQGAPVRRRRAARDDPGAHRADRQLRQADRRHQPDARTPSPTTARSTSS